MTTIVEDAEIEEWALKREESRLRRRGHRDKAPELLREAGIEYMSFNNGAHLVVLPGGSKIDFWPGTGKWKERPKRPVQHGSLREGRGVFNLVKHVNGKMKPGVPND